MENMQLTDKDVLVNTVVAMVKLVHEELLEDNYNLKKEVVSLHNVAKDHEAEIDNLLFRLECKEEEINDLVGYVSYLEGLLIIRK